MDKLDLPWIVRSLEVLARPISRDETGIGRIAGLDAFIENLKGRLRAAPSARPTPRRRIMDKLDLDGIELDLKTHHTSTRTSEVFRGHIRDLLAEIRLQRAAPAPKGEAPEIPSQGSPGTREADTKPLVDPRDVATMNSFCARPAMYPEVKAAWSRIRQALHTQGEG